MRASADVFRQINLRRPAGSAEQILADLQHLQLGPIGVAAEFQLFGKLAAAQQRIAKLVVIARVLLGDVLAYLAVHLPADAGRSPLGGDGFRLTFLFSSPL